MADGSTPNFNFILPEDGLSRNTWGIKLNQNWTNVDLLIAALFPIGKIEVYFDAATDPNTFLPGTWERFAEGRALVGVGTSNADDNGETRIVTAGEEFGGFNHPLAASEVPAHAHTLTSVVGSTDPAGAHVHTVDAHGHAFSGTTDLDGEHNHTVGGVFTTGGTLTPSGGGTSQVTSVQTSSDGAHTHSFSGDTGNASPGTDSQGSHTHTVNITGDTDNAGGGNSHNNIQPSIGVHYWRRTA